MIGNVVPRESSMPTATCRRLTNKPLRYVHIIILNKLIYCQSEEDIFRELVRFA